MGRRTENPLAGASDFIRLNWPALGLVSGILAAIILGSQRESVPIGLIGLKWSYSGQVGYGYPIHKSVGRGVEHGSKWKSSKWKQ